MNSPNKRGRKKEPFSLRSLANGCSHTSVSKSAELMRIAGERGCDDELQKRVLAGERIGSVVKDLLPDVFEKRQVKQRVASFKSAVRKLIEEHDVEPAILIAYVVENFGKVE